MATTITRDKWPRKQRPEGTRNTKQPDAEWRIRMKSCEAGAECVYWSSGLADGGDASENRTEGEKPERMRSTKSYSHSFSSSVFVCVTATHKTALDDPWSSRILLNEDSIHLWRQEKDKAFERRCIWMLSTWTLYRFCKEMQGNIF